MIRNNKVGLGTFPLVGVFNPISSNEAELIVRQFLDEGGYYIDAAPLYGNGQVESLLGKVLTKIPRDKFYLITKTVKMVDENGKYFMSGKYGEILRGMDYSLDRLGLSYVDQLMIHKPADDASVDETLGAMEELQKMGKIRDLAVSNVNLEELKQYNKSGKIKVVENSFSMINRSVNEDLGTYLVEKEIKLLPYHLLEIGQLTDMALQKINLRTEDLRNKVPYWNDENQKVIFEWVRHELAPIAQELDVTISQLNIAWALQQKFIDFVIIGTTNPKYLSINLKANDIKLDKSTLEKLEKAYLKLETLVKDKYGKTMREFRGLNEKYY